MAGWKTKEQYKRDESRQSLMRAAESVAEMLSLTNPNAVSSLSARDRFRLLIAGPTGDYEKSRTILGLLVKHAGVRTGIITRGGKNG